MPPRNKCFCRAFSIDRRGGYYENFFCRDLGEFALACRRRGVGGNVGMSEACSTAGGGGTPATSEPVAAGGGLLYMQRAVRGFMRSADNLLQGGGRSAGSLVDLGFMQPSPPAASSGGSSNMQSLTVRHGGKSGALLGLSSGRRSQPDPRTLRGVVLARWGEGNGPHAGRVG